MRDGCLTMLRVCVMVSFFFFYLSCLFARALETDFVFGCFLQHFLRGVRPGRSTISIRHRRDHSLLVLRVSRDRTSAMERA